MIKESIFDIVNEKNLSEETAANVMNEIMEGQATNAQIASFITALRMKGETISEITGFAKVMRNKSITLNINKDIIVDTCGTGGDSIGTFNVSTVTAFVIAGAGLTVAKHGNKAISSKCGSADVLQKLGIDITISPEKMKQCIEEIGIGFLFAPIYHKAMKFAITPRQEIGIRTVFNILGPLTNPAKANVCVLGVYDPDITNIMAEVLKNLGAKGAFVVHGEGGMDEITITGKSKITQLKNNKVETYYIHPRDFGFETAPLKEIMGGSPEENANILKDILNGAKGIKRDIVLLNSAAALVAADAADNIKDAVKIAEESIDSGKALAKLKAFIEFTRTA